MLRKIKDILVIIMLAMALISMLARGHADEVNVDDLYIYINGSTNKNTEATTETGNGYFKQTYTNATSELTGNVTGITAIPGQGITITYDSVYTATGTNSGPAGYYGLSTGGSFTSNFPTSNTVITFKSENVVFNSLSGRISWQVRKVGESEWKEVRSTEFNTGTEIPIEISDNVYIKSLIDDPNLYVEWRVLIIYTGMGSRVLGTIDNAFTVSITSEKTGTQEVVDEIRVIGNTVNNISNMTQTIINTNKDVVDKVDETNNLLDNIFGGITDLGNKLTNGFTTMVNAITNLPQHNIGRSENAIYTLGF